MSDVNAVLKSLNTIEGNLVESKRSLGEIKETQREHSERLFALEQRGAGSKPGEFDGTAADPLAAYKQVLDNDSFRAFKDSKLSSTGKLEIGASLKAVTSTQAPVAPQRQNQIVSSPEPALTLLDLLQIVPANSNSYEAPTLSSDALSSSGYQEGEGTDKPEGDFALDWSPFTIATIAQHVSVSRQLLDDHALLAATIDRVIRYKLRKKIEAEILSGDGLTNHIKGLLTYGAPVVSTPALTAADRLGEAAAAMEDQGYIPSAAVLRSAEMFKIESERDTNGAYVADGWSRPESANLWGSRIAKTGSMPVNTGLLLDLGWISLLERQRVTVELSREHGTNFTKNLVTILCEARVGLYVADPGAVREVTLA